MTCPYCATLLRVLFALLLVSCADEVSITPASSFTVTIRIRDAGRTAQHAMTRVSPNGLIQSSQPPLPLDAEGTATFVYTYPQGTRGSLFVSAQAITDDALLSHRAEGNLTVSEDKDTTISLELEPVDLCGSDAYCFARPQKPGTFFTDVWGTADDDVWVVGESGRPLHFDGFAISETPLLNAEGTAPASAISPRFAAIHGTSRTDVWAISDNHCVRNVCESVLWKYDGKAFRQVYTRVGTAISFRSLWVTPSRVWAGAWQFDRNGNVITQTVSDAKLPTSVYEQLLAPNSADPEELFWMRQPDIWHWKDNQWSIESTDGTIAGSDQMYNIWGSSPDNLYVSDHLGLLTIRRSASGWIHDPVLDNQGNGHFCAEENDCWFVNGGQYYAQRFGPRVLQHWNGTKMDTVTPLVEKLRVRRVFAPAGSAQGSMFLAADAGVLYRFDRKSRQLTMLLAGASQNLSALRDIYGFAPNDIWAVGDDGTMVHYDGTSWRNLTAITSKHLRRIWGQQANDVWVVGDAGTIIRIISGKPVQVPSGTTEHLQSVWGLGQTKVFAVGDNSTQLLWDFTKWNPWPGTGAQGNLKAVFASSDKNIWIGGDKDGQVVLYRFDGTKWSAVNCPTLAGPIQNIRGTSAQHTIVAGNTVCVFDGTTWTSQTSRSPSGIIAFGPARWMSVGDNWAPFYNGQESPKLLPGPKNAYGVWGPHDQELWIAGDYGTIWRTNPRQPVPW